MPHAIAGRCSLHPKLCAILEGLAFVKNWEDIYSREASFCFPRQSWSAGEWICVRKMSWLNASTWLILNGGVKCRESRKFGGNDCLTLLRPMCGGSCEESDSLFKLLCNLGIRGILVHSDMSDLSTFQPWGWNHGVMTKELIKMNYMYYRHKQTYQSKHWKTLC